jgi:hypothetical protein
MQAPYENNAAGRLVDVFNDVLKTEKHENLSQMWWRILKLAGKSGGKPTEIPADNFIWLYERMIVLNTSLDRVERDVKEHLTDRVDLIVREFPRFRQILTPRNWEAQRSILDGIVTESGITVLSFVAKDLPLEGNITPEEFTDVANTIHRLYEDIRLLVPYFDAPGYNGQDISEEQKKAYRLKHHFLKVWLMKLVRAMIDAMEMYPFCGTAPLNEATAQVLGQMVLERKTFNEFHKLHPTAYQQLLGVIDRAREFASRTARRAAPLMLTAASFALVEASKEIIKTETRNAIEYVDPSPSQSIDKLIKDEEPKVQPKAQNDDDVQDGEIEEKKPIPPAEQVTGD